MDALSPVRKVLDTRTLLTVNAHTQEKGLNRALPDSLIQRLAPDGWRLACHLTHHTNFEGQESERVKLLVAVRGTVEPEVHFLDMVVSDFHAQKDASSF